MVKSVTNQLPKMNLYELLQSLLDGYEMRIPLHQYKYFEMVKKAALDIMGPLMVTIDIKNEHYVFKRDVDRRYMEDPDKWY